MSALPSSSAASAPCNHSTDTAACGQKNSEGASTFASPVAAAGVCVDSDFPSSQIGNLKSYFDSLFSGDLCCKLWFTTPRSSSRKLLSRLTDLLRAAAGEQRKNLNCHIPADVLRSLAGHTREKVCLANHKAFWPYPPTLMHLFNDLEVYAGAQCMGDMVVQNSSQLHWGVNIAGGIKAESSNCAGKDFWRFCSECSDGLFCGPETDLLQHVFHTARKEYWASRRVKNWRKKKGLCWGYHGCGCIRPRALGLEEAEREMEGEEMPAETGRQGGRASGGERKRKRGHTNDNNGNTNSNNDNDVSCAATACSEAFKGAKKKNEEFIISKKRAKKKKGWGRPFDWVDLFKSLKVNLCWEEWERLKWLTCTDQTNTANAMQTNEREIRTNEEDKRDSSEQQQQQLLLPPPSLLALLEENYELQRGSGGTEEQTKGEVDSHDKEKTTKNQGDNTQRKRPANDHEDEKRQWEVDGNVSCIRFVRSVSPQLLRIMPACTHIDISSPPLRRNKRNNTLQTEGGGDASAATDEPKDERQARECAPVPPGEDNSPSSSPFFSAAAAAPAGGGGSGDECEQIATVEFQRMWPVFVRVGEESRLPVSASAGEEGVVLFLGCLLEVFHMRIQTEKELALCLKGIADAATADLNTAPESDRQHEGFERQANSKKDKSNNGSNSNSSSKNNKSNNKNNGSSNNTSNNNNVSSNNTCRSPTSSAPTPLGLPEQFVEASTQATDNSSQTVNDLQEARRLPLASCGDDNHKDGRGDATTLIRKRLIPPILFEPAPRRPQRLSAPPSSGGAAAVEDAELVSAATAVTRGGPLIMRWLEMGFASVEVEVGSGINVQIARITK